MGGDVCEATSVRALHQGREEDSEGPWPRGDDLQ